MKKITVVGTGYVGLVSGSGISDFGHQVTCTDIDEKKIDALNNGKIPIYEPGLESLVAKNVSAERLSFSMNVPGSLIDADVVFIAVGTPQDDNGEADISAVLKVAEIIGKNLQSYTVVCTKSTVPIGTGRQVIDTIRKFSSGEFEFDYVSNPEFLREGAAVWDFTHPDRIVIGTENDRAFQIMKEVYHPLFINETPIVHTNIETAEMIKYASNAFLALKISYINEIANLCEAVGADVHHVAKTMGIDGRISPKFLHPGPGFGGSCFPKDTSALVAQAEKAGVSIRTVAGAIETNYAQGNRMVEKLIKLTGGSFQDKQVAVLGLSFKPQTDDVRESPAIPVIKGLLKAGAKIRAFDPIAMKNMAFIFPDLNYCDSWESAVENSNAAVIMTDWNEFRGLDVRRLAALMEDPVVLDTRNILNMKELENAGIRYDNVGRKKAIN